MDGNSAPFGRRGIGAGTQTRRAVGPYRAARRTRYSVQPGGEPMRRRWGGPLLAVLVLVALGACAGGSTAQRSRGGFRVGLVTDVGKVDDKSFNQAIWEGVQAAQREVPGVTETKYI